MNRLTLLHRLTIIMLGTAALLFVAICGAIAGAIGTTLVLAVTAPLWLADFTRAPFAEDLLIGTAIGGGGLAGAIVAIVLILNVALRDSTGSISHVE